jgi:hypothetical protein
MGNPRKWTTKYNANNEALQGALKDAGVRSQKRRRELIARAASGRPADLHEKARKAVAQRRAASLDMNAGTK